MNKKGDLSLEKIVAAILVLMVLAFGVYVVSKGFGATKPITKYQFDIQEQQCIEGIKLKYVMSGKDVPSSILGDVDNDDIWDQCDRCVCQNLENNCANIIDNDQDEDGIYKGCDADDRDAKKVWNSNCANQIKILREKGKPLRCTQLAK